MAGGFTRGVRGWQCCKEVGRVWTSLALVAAVIRKWWETGFRVASQRKKAVPLSGAAVKDAAWKPAAFRQITLPSRTRRSIVGRSGARTHKPLWPRTFHRT